MVQAATAAAGKGRCSEQIRVFPLSPNPALTDCGLDADWWRIPDAKHLQTTTPACKDSHTHFIWNAFIHRYIQSFMHLHTTTFIHILATTPAVHLPAKPGQVYTQEYAVIRLHSTPPLLHTHKVCLLLLFPEGGGSVQLWSVQNPGRNKFLPLRWWNPHPASRPTDLVRD